MHNFTETIEDLSIVMTGNNDVDDATFSKMVTNIRTYMSDLGPISPLFSEKLKKLRESLLPKAIEIWDKLSPLQQSKIVRNG